MGDGFVPAVIGNKDITSVKLASSVLGESIKCMSVNARSVLSNFKVDELNVYAQENNFDVISIAELWLNENVSNGEVAA